MAGYRGFEGLSWVDAFLNAAMILSGMGPAAELHTTEGKVFAGCECAHALSLLVWIKNCLSWASASSSTRTTSTPPRPSL